MEAESYAGKSTQSLGTAEQKGQHQVPLPGVESDSIKQAGVGRHVGFLSDTSPGDSKISGDWIKDGTRREAGEHKDLGVIGRFCILIVEVFAQIYT